MIWFCLLVRFVMWNSSSVFGVLALPIPGQLIIVSDQITINTDNKNAFFSPNSSKAVEVSTVKVKWMISAPLASFPQTHLCPHWLDQMKAPPKTLAIGWAIVAVSGWSKVINGCYISSKLRITYIIKSFIMYIASKLLFGANKHERYQL